MSRTTLNETSHENNDRTSTTKQSSSFIQLLSNNTHCDPKQPGQTDDPLSSRLLHVWRRQADVFAQAENLLAQSVLWVYFPDTLRLYPLPFQLNSPHQSLCVFSLSKHTNTGFRLFLQVIMVCKYVDIKAIPPMKQHFVCIKSNVVTLNKLHNIKKHQTVQNYHLFYYNESFWFFKHVQHVWVILYSHIWGLD